MYTLTNVLVGLVSRGILMGDNILGYYVLMSQQSDREMYHKNTDMIITTYINMGLHNSY